MSARKNVFLSLNMIELNHKILHLITNEKRRDDLSKQNMQKTYPPKISQRLSGYGISSRLNKIRKLVVKGELKKLNLIVPDKNEE